MRARPCGLAGTQVAAGLAEEVCKMHEEDPESESEAEAPVELNAEWDRTAGAPPYHAAHGEQRPRDPGCITYLFFFLSAHDRSAALHLI